MEKKIIKCRIDVSKINKSKIYSGEKGKWYDFTLIETPDGKYSVWMVTEDVTKEERQAGVKGTILGNGKTWKPKEESAQENPYTEKDDDLPF